MSIFHETLHSTHRSSQNVDRPVQHGSGMADLTGLMMDKTFQDLYLEKRCLFLWGAVHDVTAKDIVDRLLYLHAKDAKKDIYFLINSPGGVVTSGMVIHDVMKMIDAPIHTICMGLAASMGSILLSAGTKGSRSIWSHGRVMIHQPSIGGFIRGSASDLEIHAKEIEKTKRIGASILAKNCGKTTEKVLEDFDRDYWMDAKESVQYGIVDHVMEKLPF